MDVRGGGKHDKKAKGNVGNYKMMERRGRSIRSKGGGGDAWRSDAKGWCRSGDDIMRV